MTPLGTHASQRFGNDSFSHWELVRDTFFPALQTYRNIIDGGDDKDERAAKKEAAKTVKAFLQELEKVAKACNGRDLPTREVLLALCSRDVGQQTAQADTVTVYPWALGANDVDGIYPSRFLGKPTTPMLCVVALHQAW